MLIYSPHITSRLLYVANWLGEQTGEQVICTNEQQQFEHATGVCINYSSKRIKGGELWIQPNGILFEQRIQPQSIDIKKENKLPVFFQNESDLGFDFLAAVFFLLSRYEEYLTDEKDMYGRYPHTRSVAYQHHFLNRPLIDEWLQLLLMQLKEKFPEASFKVHTFQFIPTYDIDIAYCYKGKGFIRNLAGCFLRPMELLRRIRVLSGKEKDPFDAYEYLEALHKKVSPDGLCFLLTAHRRSELDKNIMPRSPEFKNLVQSLSRYTEIGLHPSVFSSANPAYLIQEKIILESIVEKSVRKSRFHFLKFNLPDDYTRLIEAGITDDYSMGYGTTNGFRASTSRSFLWYNLIKEETSALRIHPFAWMDANSYYEQQLHAEQAVVELKQYREKIKSVNGTLITISHNHFLGTEVLLKNWTQHYKTFLQETSGL